MNRVAHDGMRVRAHAGAASFRRRETLQELMQDAQAQVQPLKLEVADDPRAWPACSALANRAAPFPILLSKNE